MYKKVITTFILLLTLTSCTTTDDNKLLGKIIGSGLGALVGFQFGSGVGGALFIAGGTVLGGFIGNEIAEELSAKELSEYGNATKDALDENTNNEAKMWANKDKTKLGKIIPLNNYKNKKFMCRDVEQNLTSDGIETKSVTTFCRNNKGDWEII
jgi:surface antigen